MSNRDWTPAVADPRPDLMALFTPFDSDASRRCHRFDELRFSPYFEGVEVAAVPAAFIDGVSEGIAGYVARTAPKRATKQSDPIMWVGYIRVKVAPGADEKTTAVYHVGTGGPLYASRLAAGEAAKAWRWGTPKADQTTLALVK